MNRWRSSSGALAALLWSVILLSGAFGCGITREVSLPNGYICYVDDYIWIAHPDILGDVVRNIEELDVQHDVVFGSTRDEWDEALVDYFILDTQLQVVWNTTDYNAWSEQLVQLGIEQHNLRWPGVNFNGFSFWRVIVSALGLGTVLFLVAWAVLLIGKHEGETRQDRLDRL
ncbi:MAG: hypothetical protein ACF8MF_08845 [Phycisphaerales bacterium JB052]